MKHFTAVVVFTVLLIAGVGEVARAQTYNAYLTGHGVSSSLGMDVTIAASRATDGTASDVLQVVPPSRRGNVG